MRILYEDSRLFAVDKDPGEIVIPGREGAVGASLRERLESERGEKLFVVHRIDVGTSGALLFAKDPEAHRALSLAFSGCEVKKVYLALVVGSPPVDTAKIDVLLHEARRGKMRPARADEPGAKPARTNVFVRERFGDRQLSLVEARPETGRHHQIRVHLKSWGHPLAFDPSYGSDVPLVVGEAKLERTPLHAARLTVPHPDGTGRLEIVAPLADDLDKILAGLRSNVL